MVVGPHPHDLCLRDLWSLGFGRSAYLLSATFCGLLIPNP